MFKVVENSCRYTVPPDVTSTFHEGQSWSILMAPYDASSTGGWNPDEGFYYNEWPNFFTAVNVFTFYDVDRNGVGCGIQKQRGLSNAAIAGIGVGSAVWGFLVCLLVLGSILARQQTRLEKKVLAVYPDAASVWLDATGTNTIHTIKPKNYSRPSKANAGPPHPGTLLAFSFTPQTGIKDHRPSAQELSSSPIRPDNARMWAEPQGVRIAPVSDANINSLPSLKLADDPDEVLAPTYCCPSTRTLSSPVVVPEEVDHDADKIQQDDPQPSNCMLDVPRKD